MTPMLRLLALAAVMTATMMLYAAEGRETVQNGMVALAPKGAGTTVVFGAPAAATRATVRWDDTALRFDVECIDAHVTAAHTQRDDFDLWQDDCLEVFLDLGHTHNPVTRPWVHIIASASGGLADAAGGDPWYDKTGGDARFTIIGLASVVTRTTDGWRCTLTIPWKGLGATPHPGDVWGFNLNRENHPEEEYTGWAPTHGGFGSYHEWGHLVFAPAGRRTVPQRVLEAITRTHDAIPPLVWQAGTARVNITPTDPVWMAGYGFRDHPAEGTRTNLWAKALVLEDAAGHRAVLVTLDLLGLDRKVSQTICARLAQQYGLRRDQMALCFSHTHSGPVVGTLLHSAYPPMGANGDARIAAYTAALELQIVAVVGQAMQTLAPARVSWGSGQAGFAVNRRMNQESNISKLRATGQLTGPVDHDVPVLAVRGETGRLIAVVFGYACHATVLDTYLWDGDYPGYAQTELETRYPGVQAMFWAGCGADQNPLPRRTVELAQGYGHALADAVNAVLSAPMTSLTARLQTRYREIALPYATVTPGYPYPVGRWQLGDTIQWHFLGGETVVDYALRLKSHGRDTCTWVTGYANDVMAYIPSRRVLLEGGYEATGATAIYGQPDNWAPTLEALILHAAENR